MRTPGKRLLTRLVALIVLVLVLGKFTSCEPEDWMLSVDCADCYGYKPDSANLIINLTINSENDSVPLTFYLGDYEDGVIDWQDTATTAEFRLYSKMNERYTVRATYRSGNKIIQAFDSDKMTLYTADAECGSPCYIVKGGIFDLTLAE
jgi:hypothetical protein